MTTTERSASRAAEPSGDYYDYTRTMQPERPWLVQWHQRFVYRIMHALRGGLGRHTRNPAMTARRPHEHRCVFGDGKIANLCVTFEEALEVIRRVHHLTAGIPQVVLLTGWQFEGHDSKYPSWAEASPHLKRDADATAIDSLRWLIREARRFNCLATLHVNMFDAYEDSPLFQEYLDKHVLAKDKDGRPIIGNRWWGMDCYHVSYTQEWKLGLAQKRIDDLLAMVPELAENHCIYLDAFLGARVADQKGPISPYLGFSKEEEARTQRKIMRYWRDKGVDPAAEHVVGLRVDRFVGLQPYSAAQMNLIADLPHALYTSSPYHAHFWDVAPPPEFHERFCLEVLPYYYRNHPAGTADTAAMMGDGDVCMPALWCAEPTLMVYSKRGRDSRPWPVPAEWHDAGDVRVARLTIDGPVAVADGRITGGSLPVAAEPNVPLVVTRRRP